MYVYVCVCVHVCVGYHTANTGVVTRMVRSHIRVIHCAGETAKREILPG